MEDLEFVFLLEMTEATEHHISQSSPFGPPLPPVLVEIERVASSPSSLAIYFTLVSYFEDKASVVTGFFVEWSTTEDFLPGTVWDTTLAAKK